MKNKSLTISHQPSVISHQLTIGWLYPELMSTYGDRGNITVFQKRCAWRGIKANIIPVEINTSIEKLQKLDLIFGGGAQDREQEFVMKDLKKGKGKVIKELIEINIPALFVCGSPQLMGNYYEPAVGKRINGLGIFDITTIHPGIDKPRLIGNIVVKVFWENLINPSDGKAISSSKPKPETPIPYPLSPIPYIIGFENHGGRTYLGKNAKPFAKVIKGFGNNGEDGTEGVIYKNAIGTYLHGPLLPKNPDLADYLIQKSLEIKYKEKIDLIPLDDELEQKAKEAMLKRLKIIP